MGKGWRIQQVANGFILLPDIPPGMAMGSDETYVFASAELLGQYVTENFGKTAKEKKKDQDDDIPF